VALVAVDIQHVSKRFRLYQERYTSLKERVIHAGRSPYRDLWALDDVTFEVAAGETVGILGRNGSGKSTLLKCVCGVLQPTSGQVVVRGQLAGLLELGAGFQQELSGRDNIYLNGSLLGLSKRDIDRVFDDIVEFAELGDFIDNQVKFYSSGMYVRLGFAVAVSVEPDVLVVDEVLAVGDERFQRKCLNRIKDFQNQGRTIFFVTHAADLVRQICDRGVVLDQGKVIAAGPAAEAIEAYHQHLVAIGEAMPSGDPGRRFASQRVLRITDLALEHPGQGSRAHLLPGEPLTIRFGYRAITAVDHVVFSYSIFSQDGTLVHATDTNLLGTEHRVAPGSGVVEVHFDEVPLLDGTYVVHVGISSSADGQIYDVRENQATFTVMNPGRNQGMVALEPRFEVRTGQRELAG
jgi:ABC-2 type transport system ATP-binding protein